jgi:hypothetical protein
MSQENCPDLADVRRYLLGQPSHVEGAPLEAHLLHCRRCAELAESLATEDVLLDAMRAQQAAAPDPDSDLIEQVIGRLKGLSVSPTPSLPPPVTTPPEGPNGLRAELFADLYLHRCVKVRYDPQIDFNWGVGSPDPLVPADYFSIRWTGWLKAPKPGKYTLLLQVDDGARLWLDGRLVIDCWRWSPGNYSTAEVDLTDRPHEIRIEYFELQGDASVRLSWAQKDGFAMQPVPSSALFHDRAAAEKPR